VLTRDTGVQFERARVVRRDRCRRANRPEGAGVVTVRSRVDYVGNRRADVLHFDEQPLIERFATTHVHESRLFDAMGRWRRWHQLRHTNMSRDQRLLDLPEVVRLPALAGGSVAKEHVAAAKDDSVAGLPGSLDDHEPVGMRPDVDEHNECSIEVVAGRPDCQRLRQVALDLRTQARLVEEKRLRLADHRRRPATVVGADHEVAAGGREGGDVVDQLEEGSVVAQVELALVVERFVLVSLA